MKMYDNENDIIEHFQMLSTESICLLTGETEEIKTIVSSILKEEEWKTWINSSGKGDPPPDFYNDELKIMMEVMRADDHGFISPKGKTVNPTRQRESEIMSELQEKGILDKFPNAKLFINAVTDLPTQEDHNYEYYRNNFRATVEKHIKNIERYKKNHPGYKAIFLIFDESSAYFEMAQPNANVAMGEIFQGKPHLWFLDKGFVDVFKNSEMDFLIWFAPYKHCTAFSVKGGKSLDLPQAVVYDVKNMEIPLEEYNVDLMESAEV